LHGGLIEDELAAYFTCDAERSVAVVKWAYQLAHQNELSLWVGGNEFVGVVGSEGVSAETFIE